MALPLIDGLPLEAQARFKVLQQNFVAGLAGRYLEIQAATTALARQTALHRLCGSAGSYGFKHLSQCARAAEALALSGRQQDLTQALVLLKVEIDLVQAARHTANVAGRP